MTVVQMKVIAYSKREEVRETGPDSYDVLVKSSFEKGRATNDALKLLAKFLRVPFSKLMLTAKDGQQEKTVLINI